jgi:hypothetical protein
MIAALRIASRVPLGGRPTRPAPSPSFFFAAAVAVTLLGLPFVVVGGLVALIIGAPFFVVL